MGRMKIDPSGPSNWRFNEVSIQAGVSNPISSASPGVHSSYLCAGALRKTSSSDLSESNTDMKTHKIPSLVVRVQIRPTFFTEPNEAETISHKSMADSFSMATKASTGGICRPSAPPLFALVRERRRDPLLPATPPPDAAAAEELEIEENILSHASSSGPSLDLHLAKMGGGHGHMVPACHQNLRSRSRAHFDTLCWVKRAVFFSPHKSESGTSLFFIARPVLLHGV